MKKLLNILKFNFIPLVMCVGIGIAFQPSGGDITMYDVMIGMLIGYYLGIIYLNQSNKQ
jgi:hypothetical protein